MDGDVMGALLVTLMFSFMTLANADATTHVANAFHDPVFVRVDSEHAHLDSISASAHLGIKGLFSVGGSFSLNQTWNQFIKVGFAKVNPLEYVAISPEGETVYVSIWTAYEGFIWTNIPEEPDLSFIVTTTAGVIRSRNNNIWEDTAGRNVKPSVEDVERRATAAREQRQSQAHNVVPTTHIANAFHDTVFARVDTERGHIEIPIINSSLQNTSEFSVSFNFQQTCNQFIEVGFAKINPLEYVAISPGEGTVYITIWTAHEGFIWINIPQGPHISFIVTTTAGVIRSRNGNIWEDTSGQNVKPTIEEAFKRAADAESQRVKQDAKLQDSENGVSAVSVRTYTSTAQMCVIAISVMVLF